jgi:hypothetical protein
VQSSRRLVVFLAAAVAGCGPSPSAGLVPVSGRLTYRGKGVPLATVQLLPEAGRAEPVPTATGQTGEDGAFTLQTPPRGRGVAPGRYRVTVQQYNSAIPTKYANPATTKLQVEVPAGGLPNWQLTLRD